MDFRRDGEEEDDGREFDTIGELVIGDAVIGREDDPASNDWDNGLHGCFECEDDGR
jgi:hypothetical protein